MPAVAQHRVVVLDIETYVPVAGANVQGTKALAVTDSMGYVTVNDSCRTLLFSHVDYESRLINRSELTDTVYLISRLRMIDEVVVMGRGKPKDDKLEELNKSLRLSPSEAQLISADPNSGMNVMGLLKYIIPKSWRKSKKSHKERLKETLENY